LTKHCPIFHFVVNQSLMTGPYFSPRLDNR